MATSARTPAFSIILITALYIVQGLNIGLSGTIPFFLASRGATWKDQGTLKFAMYPFSLKLLWAPLIDSIYSTRFGRRKSWLVPIQLSMAGILLLFSWYAESLIANTRVILLTVIMFSVVALTATQDICVDGLAISLFSATNPQWASTSQTIGQTFGRFVGSSSLLMFESANFTNRFIREPLSLPPQESGLITLEYFIRFAAIGILVVTTYLIFFFRENHHVRMAANEESNLSLYQTYLSIFKLFKKSCIQKLTLVSLLAPFGLVAINYMTLLTLVSQGVPREYLALINIPTTLVTMIAPIAIRDTNRPLTWFNRSYVMCLVTGIPIAVYVYFTPRLISFGFYYPLLILLLSCNDCAMTLRFSSQIGFYAFISEPRIGATYMTLLVTLSNLGFALNSTLVMYTSHWLPTKYAFVIAVGSCTLIGFVWLILSLRTLNGLQNLPTHKWYLMPEVSTKEATMPKEEDQDDPETSLHTDE